MSQGATKKKVQRMLLLEAFLYAVVGAIIGSVVGCGGLAILTRLISPYKKYGIYNEVHFNPVHIVIGCAFAVILSLYSAHAPIRKIKKLQVKEVILNRVPDFANEVTLFEMELTKKYSFIILSIKRGNRRVTVSKDTMLVKGDVIVAYCLISDIRSAFVDSLGDEKKNDTIVVDRSNEIQLVNNYGENSLTDVYVEEVPKEIENTKIKDTRLNDRFNITVAVIKRNDEYIFVNKDTIIQKGDTVTLFGPYKNIKLLFNNEKK
jgi:Trk K+ transport system NAD-binding subunit